MSDPRDDQIDLLLRSQSEGAVADEGFSERVMQRIPGRRRMCWPLWLGALIGSTACALSLARAPLLLAGWRDWMAGQLSGSIVGLWIAMLCMAWLALGWGLAEGRDR